MALVDSACNIGKCQDSGGTGVCTPMTAKQGTVCVNPDNGSGPDWCQAGRCVENNSTGPIDAIDLSLAVVSDSPSDVASWPVTTAITRLEMRATDPDAGLAFDFSARAT